MPQAVEQNEAGLDPSFEELESLLDGTAQVLAAEPVKPAEAPPARPTKTEAAVEQVPPAEPVKQKEGDLPQPGEPEAGQQGTEKKRDKLAELAFKRREAERRAREADGQLSQVRGENERLHRELEGLKSGQPSASAAEPSQAKPSTAAFDKPKPLMKDYTAEGGKLFKEGQEFEEGAQRFHEDLIAWDNERRDFEAAKRVEAKSDEEFNARVRKDMEVAMDEHPDFEDARDFVLKNASSEIQVAITNLPPFDGNKASWTEVVAYLYDHPDELRSINSQFQENRIAAIAQLGVIWNSLKPAPSLKAAPAANGTRQAPRKAPNPPREVGAGGAPAPVNLEADDLDMDTFVTEVQKHLGIKSQ